MRDYELELIAGLVEGRLDDETEARALIASSSEAAEEYRAQKLAFETLQGLETVSMSDTERAALHRDVWTTLRAQPTARTANPWWYRWTAVAAALIVVGGSAAVLSQNLGGDEQADTFAEIAAPLDSGEGESATTTAAASEATTESGDDTDSGGDGATITTAADAGDGGDLSSDRSALLYSARATEVRQGAVTEPDMKFYENDEPVDPAISGCVAMATEDAGLEGFTLIATMDDPDPVPDSSTTTSTGAGAAIQPDLAVASPANADPAAAALAFVDLDTCQVVYLDE